MVPQSSPKDQAHCGSSCSASNLTGTSRCSTTEITAQVRRYCFCLTLFAQRQLASDLGKVLAAIQVPPSDAKEFDGFLNNLGYPYVEETENEVYKRYLRC